MVQPVQSCANSKNTDQCRANKNHADESWRVPAKERRERVLEFIEEHDMPLPPLAIFAGMVRQYKITFSYRTTQNILKDLVESGDAFRVDTDSLRDGDLAAVADDSSKRRSYYFITDQGRDRIGRGD